MIWPVGKLPAGNYNTPLANEGKVFSIQRKDRFMPNMMSAKKRVRQTIKRTERNRVRRGAVKTAVRHVTSAVIHKKTEEAAKALPEAIRTIDKMAGKGTLHKNAAARKKSRLTRKVNALKKAGAAA